MNKTKQQLSPDELIAAYLNDELNSEQRTHLEEWVSVDISRKQYFYEMTEVWLAATAGQGKQEKATQAYRHFKTRIESQKDTKRFVLRFARIAAAVMAGIVLLGSGYYWGSSVSDNQPVYTMQTVEAPLGSRSRIVLSDGSVVWLNAGSRLSYASDFARQDRYIKLEGEGYFEVTHNDKLPFMVQTADIDVKVLGTKFSVKSYGDEENIEVILAEGSVNFINKNDLQASLVLTPEQQAVYNKSSKTTHIKQVPASQASNWTTGVHFFNELTLEQIAGTLEKSFDVTIVFRNEEKRTLTFYGDFSPDDTLDEILMIMSGSGKFKYKRTHDIIEFY